MKAKSLDQFYTLPSISKKCYKLLQDNFCLDDYFLFEPSAGSGSFSDLFSGDFLAIDVDPKKKSIYKADFFNFSVNNHSKGKDIFTIGNPPFGKNSSLALRFMNQAANFSKYIAFILPKTFKKDSIQNKIDPRLHLILELDIPKNSFIFENKTYDVPCVFQVWERKSYPRNKIIIKRETNYFSFCHKDEADLAIRRVGGLSGKTIIDFAKYKEPSHYYIKINKNKNEIIETLKECYDDFNNAARNTAGNPSLSKGELIFIFETAMQSK